MPLQGRALVLAASAHCWLLGGPQLPGHSGPPGGARPAPAGLCRARPWQTARRAGPAQRRPHCRRPSTRLRAAGGEGRGRGNPYDVLGLPRGAELAAVRPAFTALAATLHPDIPGTGDAAAFRDVLWAYRELSDPVRRRRWAPRRRRRARPAEAPAGGGAAYSDTLEELFVEDVVVPRRRDNALDEWEQLLRQAELREAEQRARQDWWAWERWQRAKGEADQAGQSTPRWEQEQLARDRLEVRSLIEGVYQAQGTNHKRPVYLKQSTERGKEIKIYYWDDRDGPELSGWWIGPKVGGDTVFAFSGVRAETPPAIGWQVPLGAPVDSALRLSKGQAGIEIGFMQDQ